MTSFIFGFILWAVLHSVTAAQWLKNAVEQWWGPRRYQAFYRISYNAFSLLTFLPVLLLYWRLPDRTLWAVPSPWSWFMVLIQLAGLLGLVVSVLQTKALAFAGVQQLVDYLTNKQDMTKAGLGEELVVSGLYRYMRHPLYTFSMILLWFLPVVSRNYLILAGLMTVYFLAGSILEERRLQADFGDAYTAYQRTVPRFIPRMFG